MALGKAAFRLQDDPAPALMASLDTNGFEILFDDAKAAIFGDGSDGSIAFDGTNLVFSVLSGDLKFSLPGAHGARVSRVLIEGQAGVADGEPLFKILQVVSEGNAYIIKVYVGASLKFSVDNEGDLFCGSSIVAGDLGFLGGVDPVVIYSTANNGMVFGAYHASPARSKAKFGLGSLGQKTLTAALDQDDQVILRDIDGAATYSEAGSVLRLERDVTNVTAENGNFLEFGGLAGSTYLSRIDKTGAFRGPVAVAPRVVAVASAAAPTPNADATDLYKITAQSEAATFGAPAGTPLDGQTLKIRIKDNGTPRALGWNAIFRAFGEALPTTTVTSKWLLIGFIYDASDSKWDFLGAREEL